MGGAEPVSEELKRQALSAADLALSLVDNTQETFGLAVAEAMAAGLPVVASNWNGYRDLIRHGVDGYLVPKPLGINGFGCFISLGLAAVFGIESFPVVAGALAQLVQLDADAAEKALVSLLTSTSLLQRMGRSASARAVELFSEHVVMDQYEALFADLERRRLAAPVEACMGRPMPASLDPVQAFQTYPSHPYHCKAGEETASELIEKLPRSLWEARAQMWRLLEESIPSRLKDDLHLDLLKKHSIL